MKKIVSILLVVMALLGCMLFTSCGEDKKPDCSEIIREIGDDKAHVVYEKVEDSDDWIVTIYYVTREHYEIPKILKYYYHDGHFYQFG